MKQLRKISVVCASLLITIIVKTQEVTVTNQSDRPYTVELNFAHNGLKAEKFTLRAHDGEKKLVIPAQAIRSLIVRDTRALRPQSMEITEAKLNHKDKAFQVFIILTYDTHITVAHAYTDSKDQGSTPVEKYICHNSNDH